MTKTFRVLVLISASLSGVLSSCKKTLHDVTFHGHILAQCDSSAVGNFSIEIIREYYKGGEQSDIVADATTDNNGNYSVVTDIDDKGNFEAYRIESVNHSSSMVFLGENLDKTN